MNIRVLLLTLSALTLASCANNSDDGFGKDGQKVLRPQQLNFQVPIKEVELTKEQVAQLKRTFSQKPSIQIPPSELLLKDQDSKLSREDILEQQRLENEFRYTASPESYEFYKSLRNKCSKQHGTLSFDATVPLEKITSISDVKTGDHLTTSLFGEYGGPGCDAEASGTLGYKVKADRIEKDGLASAEASYSLKALLKNSKYANLLKSKGIVATSSISGVVGKQSVDLDSDRDLSANLKFKINGSYFTVTDEIPVSTAVSVYAKPTNTKGVETQIEAVTIVKMPTFSVSVVVQLHIIDRQDGRDAIRLVENYYVNGYLKTEAELKDLFGDKFQAEESNEMIKAYLN